MSQLLETIHLIKKAHFKLLNVPMLDKEREHRLSDARWHLYDAYSILAKVNKKVTGDKGHA